MGGENKIRYKLSTSLPCQALAHSWSADHTPWHAFDDIANQFRALEEDEVQFLDTIKSEQERKELKRKLEDAEEVKGFME